MEHLLLLLLLGVLYFLPALVASRRKHRNAMPVFVLNLFFGWTLIGWVAALCWSLTHQGDKAA